MAWWNWLIAVVGCFAVTYFYWWLIKGKRIPGAGFCVAYPITLALVLVLARLDATSRFEAPGGFALSLQELKKIETNVFAKAESIEKLAGYIAEATLDAIVVGSPSQIDFAGLDVRRILEVRDRSKHVLHEAGAHPDKISSVNKRYFDFIRQRMAKDIQFIGAYLTLPFAEPVERLLVNSFDRKAFETELRAKNQWDSNIVEILGPLDHFVATQQLPQDFNNSRVTKGLDAYPSR